MTKLPALPLPASADEAERLVAQLKSDISALKARIGSDKRQRDANALQLDDEAFEKRVLETERSERSLLRLEKQVEAAETQLKDAKAREERARCRELYDAGKTAAKEVERLAAEYAKRASAVADILRQINKQAETIRLADKNLPDGERWFETYAIDLSARVTLPSSQKDGDNIWERGEPKVRQRSPGHILVDGIYTPFDASNPAHVAARNAPQPSNAPVAQRNATLASPLGMETRPDGSRAFKAPACEWPPAPEPKTEKTRDGRKRLPTDGFYGEGATR